VLLATIVAGAAGGFVYEMLMLEGNLELPHKPTADEVKRLEAKYAHAGKRIRLYDLGIWARVIIGALAGVAALFIASPTGAFRLLATSVIAGSAGTSLFDSLRDRLDMMIAQREVQEQQQVTEQALDKVDEALAALPGQADVVDAVPGPIAGAPLGAEGLPSDTEAAEARDALAASLANSRQLLDEARGMLKTVSHKEP
jgi:hypothetical protein